MPHVKHLSATINIFCSSYTIHKEPINSIKVDHLKIHKEQNYGARRIEKIIEQKYGRHIPHNAIHQVLLENGLADEDNQKKRCRKPWIRYERKHSLIAVMRALMKSNIYRRQMMHFGRDCLRDVS